MLTYSQAQTVAVIHDSEFVCMACARKTYGELALGKAELGLVSSIAGEELSFVCRYELDSFNGESAYESGRQEGLEGDELDEYAADYPGERCADCGEEI